MVSLPLAASFLVSEDPAKSPAHFSYLFAGAYEPDQSLASLSPLVEARTVFLTQSNLPLLTFWGGRLRLDGFTSRLHMQNVPLDVSVGGALRDFCPPRLGYVSGPRSVGLSGLSLSFHFGRDAQIGRHDQIWNSLGRIVHAHR